MNFWSNIHYSYHYNYYYWNYSNWLTSYRWHVEIHSIATSLQSYAKIGSSRQVIIRRCSESPHLRKSWNKKKWEKWLVYFIVQQMPYLHTSPIVRYACRRRSNSCIGLSTGPNLNKFIDDVDKSLPLNLLKSKLRYPNLFRNAMATNKGAWVRRFRRFCP